MANETKPLQRKCECGKCAECEEEKLQRKAASHGTFAVPARVRQVVDSPGAPLDAATRSLMQSRFQHDFSRVRVHHDAAAAASARAVRASAYTVGDHIVFDTGRYTPSLLTHELAHTIQQRIGRGGDYVSAEKEADTAADAVLRGAPVKVAQPAAPDPMQRQDTERDTIVGVTKRTGDPANRGSELVWRLLTRYFPEYIDRIAGAGYDEKEPSVRVKVESRQVQGKTVQSAIVTVGKQFVETTSDATLRTRIEELGLALSLSGLPATPSSVPADAIWKIISANFAAKAHRVAGTSYDAKLPGLRTEFESGKVTVGKTTAEWGGPRIFFGDDFLKLPPPDQQALVGKELDKVDLWAVQTAHLTKADLADKDITFRIRGLKTAGLTTLRDAVADPDVKAYVASLLTTSTPMEGGLKPAPGGGLTITIGRVTVEIPPDTYGDVGANFQAETPTGTTVDPDQIPGFGYDAQGIINDFPGYNPKVTIRVQTTYKPGASKDLTQGYGKGTTAREKELGATSLRYHEGSHGLDVIDFVRNNKYPEFTGAKGDTVAVFKQKAQAYNQARKAYNTALQRYTDVHDECPGISIDKYMKSKGIKWKPICP